MDTVIIEVKGGVVQVVYSANPDVKIRVLDWDAQEDDQIGELLEQIEQMQELAIE